MGPLKTSGLAVILTAFLALPAWAAAPLTALSPASVAPGLKSLAAQYTAQTGLPVTVGGGGRQAVLAAIKNGPADVVVLPTADLIELNTVHGMTPVGRVSVGLAVKAGMPKPDISTPEKFLAVLRKARGVAFADPAAGTSAGRVIANMLSGPDFKGIRQVPVQGLAVTALADGRADIALQLAPELANDPSVTLVGTLPEMYGAGVDFSVGIAVITGDAVAARDFITFITDAKNARQWQSNGLMPLFH